MALRVLLAVVATLALVGVASAHDSGFGLARYSPDGTLDRTFGNQGVVVIRSAERSFVANALALEPDGKIIIAGMATDAASGTLQLAITRYTTEGTPDRSFGVDGSVATPVGAGGAEANALALQSDGMILVTGTAFSHGSDVDQFFVGRYTNAGVLDPTFGTGGLTVTHVGAGASSAAALTVQSDGRIVVVGTAFSNGPTDDDFAVVRYTPTGQLDPEFGSGGIVTTDFGTTGPSASLDRATAVALQPGGKIITAGFTRGATQSFAVARYNTNGSLDASFGTDGKVQISAMEPQVFSVMVQSTNDVVIAGSQTGADRTTSPFALVRLHADGTPDESFGAGGVVATNFQGSRSGARAVVSQTDGKLISGGAKFGAPSAQGDPAPNSGYALARYNADGSIDATFGSGGRTLTDLGDAGALPLSLAVQSDGKILAAGLVFFQVQTPAAGPPVFVYSVAAGVAAAIAVIGIGLALRRGKVRRSHGN